MFITTSKADKRDIFDVVRQIRLKQLSEFFFTNSGIKMRTKRHKGGVQSYTSLLIDTF